MTRMGWLRLVAAVLALFSAAQPALAMHFLGGAPRVAADAKTPSPPDTDRARMTWCPAKIDFHVDGTCAPPLSLPALVVDNVSICMEMCDVHPGCKSIQVRGKKCQYCSSEGLSAHSKRGVDLYTRNCPALDQMGQALAVVPEAQMPASTAEPPLVSEKDWCAGKKGFKQKTCTAPTSGKLPRSEFADAQTCMVKCDTTDDCESIHVWDSGVCQYCVNNGSGAVRQKVGVTLYTKLCSTKSADVAALDVTTTKAPEPTTPASKPTTPAPETTTLAHKPTTPAPETTMPAPKPTTPASLDSRDAEAQVEVGDWCPGMLNVHVKGRCDTPEALVVDSAFVEPLDSCMAKCEAVPECKSIQLKKTGKCEYCSNNGSEVKRKFDGVTLYTRLCPTEVGPAAGAGMTTTTTPQPDVSSLFHRIAKIVLGAATVSCVMYGVHYAIQLE